MSKHPSIDDLIGLVTRANDAGIEVQLSVEVRPIDGKIDVQYGNAQRDKRTGLWKLERTGYHHNFEDTRNRVESLVNE